MAEHTKEPWTVSDIHWSGTKESPPPREGIHAVSIRASNNVDPTVFVGTESEMPEVLANANRIVDCVNACRGIANPAAIAEVIALMTELSELDQVNPAIMTSDEMADMLYMTNAMITIAAEVLAKLKAKP